MLKKALVLLLLGVAPGLPGAQRAKTSAKATPVPTAIPTPVAPERVPSSARKGAVTEKRVGQYQNANVSFSKLTRVDEVDLDNDGVFEALVEGIGTVRSLPPDIPAVGFVSRSRLPFENPICAVFKRGRGTDWDVLLLAHLPQRCRQSDDPVRCDQLLAFRAVEFRYDDRPQVALQIAHAGEARLTETATYRLDRDRLETTFSAAGPRCVSCRRFHSMRNSGRSPSAIGGRRSSTGRSIASCMARRQVSSWRAMRSARRRPRRRTTRIHARSNSAAASATSATPVANAICGSDG